MGRPVIGQLYALERPDVGGYFRARVCSCDGKMVQATLVDYTATVSIEKVYSLPDRLVGSSSTSGHALFHEPSKSGGYPKGMPCLLKCFCAFLFINMILETLEKLYLNF